MANRPLVASSIRDILATPTKAGRIEEAHERLERFYDLVLVHGDPRPRPARSLLAGRRSDRSPPPLTGLCRRGRRLAFLRGSAAASSCPAARAMRACRSTGPPSKRRTKFRTSPGASSSAAAYPRKPFAVSPTARPRTSSSSGSRPDFRALLARGRRVGEPGGLQHRRRSAPGRSRRPFSFRSSKASETEQRLRAERLQRLGIAALLPESQLSAKRLAGAVRDALGRAPHRSLDGLRSTGHGGVSRSSRIWPRAVPPSSRAVSTSRHWTKPCAASATAGTQPRFWWRDDDAVADTPQLRRLVELAAAQRKRRLRSR